MSVGACLNTAPSRMECVLKSFRAISHVNIELKTSSVSIIGVDVVNGHHWYLHQFVKPMPLAIAVPCSTREESNYVVTHLTLTINMLPNLVSLLSFLIFFLACSIVSPWDFRAVCALECHKNLVLQFHAWLSLNPSSLIILSGHNYIKLQIAILALGTWDYGI
jgi:hypothetical protein